MWTAYFALNGAWAWLAHKLIYDWLPVWLTDILFVIGMSAAAYVLIRERLRLRRVKLRGPGLPRSTKQPGRVVADHLALGAERDRAT